MANCTWCIVQGSEGCVANCYRGVRGVWQTAYGALYRGVRGVWQTGHGALYSGVRGLWQTATGEGGVCGKLHMVHCTGE